RFNRSFRIPESRGQLPAVRLKSQSKHSAAIDGDVANRGSRVSVPDSDTARLTRTSEPSLANGQCLPIGSIGDGRDRPIVLQKPNLLLKLLVPERLASVEMRVVIRSLDLWVVLWKTDLFTSLGVPDSHGVIRFVARS